MLPEMLTVFALASPDAQPAYSHEIFNDDMSDAEYYIYVEATASIMNVRESKKIDVGWGSAAYKDEGMGLLEVYVQFGGSGFELAQASIEQAGNMLSENALATYESEKQFIGDMNADDVMYHFEADRGARVVVSHDGNAAMWLEVTRIGRNPNDFANMEVLYRQVNDDRVLTIRSSVIFEDVTADELIKKVQGVVAQYREVPVRHYTGAVVN